MKPSKRAPRKRRLTELTVAKALPEGGAYLIWDTLQKGLAVYVQPTGHKAWKCYYSRHGRPRWLHLGDINAVALADARKLAAKTMLSVIAGGDPVAERKAERGAGTFADLAARYVEQHAKRHNRSWRQADALVRHHVLSRWGKLQASTIARADVKALMGHIAAPVSANQTLAAVSAIFSWAVKEEIMPTNPARGVDRNATRSRERIVGESELPVVWDALGDVGVEGRVLKTILLTGQRPGEVLRMRYEHIVDGWWELPGKPVPELRWAGTKNGENHRVWLPAAARAIIGDETDPGFVFAGPHGGLPQGLDGAMRALSSKLGIEPVRPHDLRRTHGSTVTALGFGRDAMNRIQNHREGGIASVYDRHQYATETKAIMEAVAAKIIGLVEGRAAGNVVPFAR